MTGLRWRDGLPWHGRRQPGSEIDAQMADGDRWLIVGLGNSGPQFAGNRHNVGYLCCDELAAQLGVTFKRDRTQAMVATGTLAGARVVLAKPISFMNESGRPVAALRRFYKFSPDRIVVIHDELDLPFGTIRLKQDGGDNGHNGVRSVTSAVGSRDYYRIRFGIGRPPGRMDPAAFVLRDFSGLERDELPALIDRVAVLLDRLIGSGISAAQNEFH